MAPSCRLLFELLNFFSLIKQTQLSLGRTWKLSPKQRTSEVLTRFSSRLEEPCSYPEMKGSRGTFISVAKMSPTMGHIHVLFFSTEALIDFFSPAAVSSFQHRGILQALLLSSHTVDRHWEREVVARFLSNIPPFRQVYDFLFTRNGEKWKIIKFLRVLRTFHFTCCIYFHAYLSHPRPHPRKKWWE